MQSFFDSAYYNKHKRLIMKKIIKLKNVNYKYSYHYTISGEFKLIPSNKLNNYYSNLKGYSLWNVVDEFEHDGDVYLFVNRPYSWNGKPIILKRPAEYEEMEMRIDEITPYREYKIPHITEDMNLSEEGFVGLSLLNKTKIRVQQVSFDNNSIISMHCYDGHDGVKISNVDDINAIIELVVANNEPDKKTSNNTTRKDSEYFYIRKNGKYLIDSDYEYNKKSHVFVDDNSVPKRVLKRYVMAGKAANLIVRTMDGYELDELSKAIAESEYEVVDYEGNVIDISKYYKLEFIKSRIGFNKYMFKSFHNEMKTNDKKYISFCSYGMEVDRYHYYWQHDQGKDIATIYEDMETVTTDIKVFFGDATNTVCYRKMLVTYNVVMYLDDPTQATLASLVTGRRISDPMTSEELNEFITLK